MGAATSSGRPATTTCPPSSPPSGPRSIIQSAILITSRLCSFLGLMAIGSQSERNAQRRTGYAMLCHIPLNNTSNGVLQNEYLSITLTCVFLHSILLHYFQGCH